MNVVLLDPGGGADQIVDSHGHGLGQGVGKGCAEEEVVPDVGGLPDYRNHDHRCRVGKYYAPENLSVYMMGYQMSIGASMLVSSKNFVDVINIGEAISKNKNIGALFFKNLKKAFLLSIASYFALVFGAMFLQKFYLVDYNDLIFIVSLLGGGMLSFFMINSITPIVFYYNKQKFLTLMMTILASLAIFHNFITYYFNFG